MAELKRNQVRVNGKLVTFKDRWPLRDSREIPKLMRDVKGEDPDSHVALLVKTIESWQFDGDPTDREAYEALDIMEEIMPMVTGAIQYSTVKAQARTDELKN